MKNFWDLVGFEFKKMTQRRAFFASIAFCLVVMAVMLFASVSGSSFWHKIGSDLSQYEAMKQDKATILLNQGPITTELVQEAIRSNQEMVQNKDHYLINEYGKYLKEDAYIQYVLPYESVVRLLNTVYEREPDWLSKDALELSSVNPDKAIDHLTPEEIEDFDADFLEFASSMVMQERGLSAREIDKNLELLSQVEMPLYNDYYGGYRAYLIASKGLGLMALFLILILLAPLFSHEYEEKTDQIILCTRNGKGSLCAAKLFVALTVSLLSGVLIMGISWLCFLLLFGFEGANVNIQVVDAGCTYPLTLLEACLIHFFCVVAACVLFGAMIAFLSAKVKRRTSAVVIAGTLLTLIPMFAWVPLSSSRFFYNVLKLFPVNAITFGFDLHFINLFGRLLPPHSFFVAVSIVLTLAFSSLAVCSFRKHQHN